MVKLATSVVSAGQRFHTPSSPEIVSFQLHGLKTHDISQLVLHIFLEQHESVELAGCRHFDSFYNSYVILEK